MFKINLQRRISNPLIWLILGCLSICPGASQAVDNLPIQPEKLRSADLQYQARKLFITANTRVQLSWQSLPQARENLLGVADLMPLQPDSEKVALTQIETSVLGRNTQIDAWMNPNGGILQISSLRTGRKERYRRYRYLQDQVYSIKRFPSNNQESQQDWSHWSKIGEDYYSLPGDKPSVPLMEPEGLFYLLNILDWSKVDSQHRLYLFDPDGIVELTLKFLGDSQTEVDYQQKLPDGSAQRIKGKVATQEILMSASPWKGTGQAENFDFLGFKGTVRLFVDPQKQVVVLMRGDIDVIGEVDVRLKNADFK
ncbi:hypothetical protein [Hahella sp. CCB-MM4]|uniref:hypothetical protein n=1 Tax=Hahella sp. (strain CCB-MM4) TaxID=1926491 RepID=UPI0011401FCD|nr:hypothetical protein [Hahella sp. CCB-MM4]